MCVSGMDADVVTILFTDLSGSTELAQRVGDEAAEDFRKEHFALLREAVAETGGEEVKGVGDGVMVAFRTPGEGLACAIRMQQNVRRAATGVAGHAAALRVGINTGEAVFDQGDWYGTPVVVAKRLCDEADDGQILTTEVVRALVGSRGEYEFGAVTPLELKGVGEPVGVCEVVWRPVAREARSERRLLERESELEQLEELLGTARSGHGRLALIEGVAGIGKTQLLADISARAEALGFEVLSARGGELERELSFGLARQLFEFEVARAQPRRRRALLSGPAGAAGSALGFVAEDDPALGGEADEFSISHGLYWLVANLSERRPLLLAVDDLHLGDRPSLRWLAYLARRLADLPVLVALGMRPSEGDTDTDLLDAIAGEPLALRLSPQPLSAQAIAAFVRSEYAAEADQAFCAACHEATGGNPFLARELIGALTDAGIEPTSARADQVLSMTPERIARNVLARLAKLPADAARLTEAAAVLGNRGELRHAATLAGLEVPAASAALDVVVAAQILAPGLPIQFVHPIIRSVIYEELPAGQRSRMHRRAADALDAERADRDVVAVHLLATAPAADPWAVDTLRQAADEESAPEQAVRYLRRALAEPPSPEQRPLVLLELGDAETLAFEPLDAAIEHLRSALAESAEPVARARAALAMSGALMDAGRPEEALEVIDLRLRELQDLRPAPGSEERELLLRSAAMRLTAEDLTGRPRDREGFERLRELAGTGATAGERVLLANLAFDALVAGTPASEAIDLAELALKDDALLDDRLYFDHHVATWALDFADDLTAASEHAAAAVEAVRARGSIGELTFALAVRAEIATRRGALRDAEEHARTALDLAGEHGLDPTVNPMAFAVLVSVLTDQGRLDDAEGIVEGAGFSPSEPASPVRAFYFHTRGRLREAHGRLDEALEDFRTAGRMMQERSIDHPAFCPWRSSAAVIVARLDQAEEAEQLVAEELAMARAWGAAQPLGVALRASALVGATASLELLDEAAAVMERSPALLERARTLLELGAARRRGGQRAAAKEPLLVALDLSHRCGAAPLEQRVRDELSALGARPRRAFVTGVESLTPSERRVAKLASAGMTNREVAQELYISMATVDKHLRAVYRKLDIPSRTDLPAALAGE